MTSLSVGLKYYMLQSQTHDLTDMLAKIRERSASKDTVSINDILEMIGRRSFGPLLVLVGLVLSTPVIGDIPGVPVIFGSLVILMGLQLVFRRKHIWIPEIVLKQNVSTNSLEKTIDRVEGVARYIDTLIKPRLKQFTGQTISYVILLVAIIVSLATPAMELVPFSANIAGAIFLLFGLALIAKDGLLALFGLIFTLLLGGLLLHFLI